MSSRLPDLGPRGEGWVLAQFILFVAIAAAGLRDIALAGRVGSWGAAAALVGVVAIGVGLVLAVRGSLDLRAAFTPFPRPNADAPLIETGAYRLVRHPIYSGLVLAATGWSLVAGSIPAVGWPGAGALPPALPRSFRPAVARMSTADLEAR